MKKLTITLSLLCAGLASAQEIKKDSVEASKQIQEVLIKAQRKKQYTDHAAYTFDQEALERAMHSKDLLETLPELQLDPMSNTIKSIKGGKTLFLVNGIEATDNQIKSIAPTNVVRVLYYDIPPARWASRADTVVNIITRNPEMGYSYGINYQSSPQTGFVNGSAYIGYTQGKHDFGLEYSVNYRDYDNRVAKEGYEYQLNRVDYVSDISRKDKFGYTMQDITARYANVASDNYTFQAKFTINPFTAYSRGRMENLFSRNGLTSTHQAKETTGNNYTNPTLDLYLSKNLGKRDELIFNFVGSHYITHSDQFNKEWDVATGVDVFNNDMKLKAKQTGLVGEVSHTHQFEKGKLSSGYRISNTAISNDLTNLLGHTLFDVNYLEQYLYTEYSGKWDKLNYRIGLGVTNVHNKGAESTQNDWAPTPKLVLSYGLKGNQSLRFTSQYTSNSPWAAALSPNVVQVAPNIVKRGNPQLEVQHVFRNNLAYTIGNKYLDLNALVFYHMVNKYFAELYVKDPVTSGYALLYENAKDYKEIGVRVSGTIKPFGTKILALGFYLQPISTRLVASDGREFKNQYIRNNFNLSSAYKNWRFAYYFNIPVYALDGSFLKMSENSNHFSASYQLKNWQFTFSYLFMGVSAQYKTKSLDGSLVNFSSSSQIFNNKNMLTFGLSYDFSFGKKLQMQKKLQNQTQGAVSF
ncbi:TonB-dependent receptor plug domain-containing protein [Bergeyella zoohelcum]|uniref:Outer membrane protein beta-barrel domain-containing protein n=1 Tax=Bergeyella zoohelcum ATCC 43767 TaxID=883096 RepID=K1LL18_9FLAO|nr:outer membrane beta-barrel protein [Bergeyella zoohelcum]EKB55276.1 hypothetical protein HMPREF9699_01901 [Bergeyella zoohelcum ATCC 43767]SUV50022.1 Uncharacterised protein [Bergeyella zoohelcum]